MANLLTLRINSLSGDNENHKEHMSSTALVLVYPQL